MRQKVRDIREGTEGKRTDSLQCVDVGNNQLAEHETNSQRVSCRPALREMVPPWTAPGPTVWKGC